MKKEKTKANETDIYTKEPLLKDYRICVISREISLWIRREVLMGKGMWGIYGDGKELPQVIMAKHFLNGDFQTGYYRDQTFMLAAEIVKPREIFAQLYSDSDPQREPMSSGRQMPNHYATRFIDKNGNWLPLAELKNISAHLTPLASQMPRALGLALASKFIREISEFTEIFTQKKLATGKEIVIATIGESASAEGMLWETLNAAALLKVPLLIVVFDDGYGISVPKKYQIAKESISELLQGFQIQNINGRTIGMGIFKARCWNYEELYQVFNKAFRLVREEGFPALVHVYECTQPQGHSTSGSHERYKPKERLEWEKEFDCLKKFKEWLLEKNIASEKELSEIEEDARNYVKNEKNIAWNDYIETYKRDYNELLAILNSIPQEDPHIKEVIEKLKSNDIIRYDNMLEASRRVLFYLSSSDIPQKKELYTWTKSCLEKCIKTYSSHLYAEGDKIFSKVKEVKPIYTEGVYVDAYTILRDNFDALLKKYPELVIFGEDCGRLGDVNKGLEGLQAKYGEHRVFDTGIREITILGQGIGLAARGFRPIAEMQYLDYLIYALQLMSDDLATLRWRTAGIQKAPLIIRTRGHRLEGIWHTGSHMAALLSLCRGIHICVPRNATQAAGFYNTLLQIDDPAVVVEVLNGYRLKEKKPENFGEFTVPLGIPEILIEGEDVSIVSYGAMIRICEEACKILHTLGIYPELIDVQTLLPYDLPNIITNSIKKTNKVIFADEDVPGGATAYMMYRTLVERGAFKYLDAEPMCITASEHRTAFGYDAPYVSKPSSEDIVKAVLQLLNAYNPQKYKIDYIV